METLQGIISRSINNADKMFDSLAYTTTSAANYNTVAFKAQRFENYMTGYGRIDGTIRTNQKQGVLMATNQPLDIAVDGPGYIPVTGKDGQVSYTRDGAFKLSNEGYLTTSDGCLVGDGIKIPGEYYRLKISGDGVVSCVKNRDEDTEILGKIPLVRFRNPEDLQSIEGNKFIPCQASGQPYIVKDHLCLKQGNLERSNVNLPDLVQDVLRLNGSVIASTRMIKVTDDLYRQAINLKQ
ncbi:MAG: flagellar hook basal-body protein [bacterium]